MSTNYGLLDPFTDKNAALELALATGPNLPDSDPRPMTVANYEAINIARLAKINELQRQLNSTEAFEVEADFHAVPDPASLPRVYPPEDQTGPDEHPEVALARQALALLGDPA